MQTSKENFKNDHHLVLGKLNDFLSNREITDTYDERYRQIIAKQLVLLLGYKKTEIESRKEILVKAGEKKAIIKSDFLVYINKKVGMHIKFNPGSIVTRRNSCVALSKIIFDYQIPIAVMTNGEDAEILDGNTGKVLNTGLENIPGKDELLKITQKKGFPLISKTKFDMASRILFAFEVDGACPCDNDICEIE